MDIQYQYEETQPMSFGLNAIHHLNEIRIWTLVYGILGIAFVALFVIAGFANYWPEPLSLGKISITGRCVITVIIALVLSLPGYYLLKFAILARKAIRHRDSNLLSRAFFYQKRYYRAVGIIIFTVVLMYYLLEVLVVNPDRQF